MSEILTETKLIPFLVEKITKGVKKQLKGYISHTKIDIEYALSTVNSTIDEFKIHMNMVSAIPKDWYAVEMMLNEHKQHKKLIFDMHSQHIEIRNELMDMKLLNIELQQQLTRLLNSTSKYEINLPNGPIC